MKRSDFIWERKLKQSCYVTEFRWYDFDDTIENVIVKLTEVSQKYTKAGYSELRLDWVTEDSYI